MAGDKNSANDTKANNVAPLVGFQFAQKPKEMGGWEAFKQFLWNSETSEFLGRTGSSWAKIIGFYIAYYTFLSGFFIGMLVIFYQTLDEKIPRWQNSNGIIGSNPGVGFRPSPADDNIESTLVFYRHGDLEGSGNWKGWVDRLEKFLSVYKEPKEDDEEGNKREEKKKKKRRKPGEPKPLEPIDCGFDRTPGEEQFCKVKTHELITGPCTSENYFGFKDGKPCFVLKLNKIYNWLPEPYEDSEAFPEDAPEDLIKHVKAKEEAGDKEVGNVVYIWCEGENPADRENLGPIDYYPSPGIPIYYFPYQNQEGYLSPIVFAHLRKPKQGILISISCKAWAHNIEHNVIERTGTTHFELMID